MTLSRLLKLSAAVAVTACSEGTTTISPPPPPPPPPPVMAGVYELTTIGDTPNTGDLEPFRSIVGNARFVALGESTHTSRGFYQAKVRLIKFMIEKMGFRALAFETPWLDGRKASEYVKSCAGTPEAAMVGMFRVWHDATVRDLLRYMCEHNRDFPNDPVTFYGFDIQEPWSSAPALRQFIQTAAPSQISRMDPVMRCLGATHINDQFFVSQEYIDHRDGRRNQAAHDDCIRGITDIESWIAANTASLISASSARSVEEARLYLVALRAWQDQLWVPDPGGYQARDYGMSQMIPRLGALQAPGKKTIIWAWNWHIARRYEEVRGWNDNPDERIGRQGARAMGSFLHDALGADYVTVGLIGRRVLSIIGVSPPITFHPQAVEFRLSQLGKNYLLVDLRQPLPESLLPAGPVYQVSQEWGNPYRQFDALLYLDESVPMTFLPIGQ